MIIQEEHPQLPVLVLKNKSVSIAKSIWKNLMEKGGLAKKLWSNSKDKFLEPPLIYGIRDTIFSIMRGILPILNFRSAFANSSAHKR